MVFSFAFIVNTIEDDVAIILLSFGFGFNYINGMRSNKTTENEYNSIVISDVDKDTRWEAISKYDIIHTAPIMGSWAVTSLTRSVRKHR